MTQPDLDALARRPQEYWTVDGLPELVMGVLWMVWGTAWLVGGTLPRGSANVYWMIVPAVLAVSSVAAVWAIKKLKARITFPRTGYVEWKEPTLGSRLGVAAVAIVVSMTLVVLLGRAGGSGRNAPTVLGVILSLAFVVASLRQRASHLLALAGVALALALAVPAIAAGWTGANWVFVGVGAATAVAGALRLAGFINRHPQASVEGA